MRGIDRPSQSDAKRPVKYLFISHDATISGAPMVLYRLFAYVREHCGRDNSNFLFRYSGPLYERARVEFSEQEVFFVRPELTSKTSVLVKVYRKLVDAVRLVILFAKLDPQIVFCNTSINTTPIIIARLFSKRVIVIIHEVSGAVRNPLGLRGWIIRQADLVVPVSISSAKLATELGVPADKVHIVHNGLDLSKYNQSGIKNRCSESEPIQLGFLAYWSPNKRLDIAIAVAKELARMCPSYPVSLMIGGMGYEEGSVEIQAMLTGIDKLKNLTIEFLGNISNPLVFYSQIDGLLITSEKESYPTVAMEAIACGIPVFSFNDLNGVSEVVGESLQKSTPRDTSLLATLIYQTYFSESHIDDMRQWRIEASKRHEYFAISRQWHQLVGLMSRF